MHVDLWGGIPHYCRLDYPFAEDARAKLGAIRRMMEERGLDVSVYTPETLAYPYSFSHPEEEVRKRTVDYFSMAMDDALLFGTNKVFLNSGCGPGRNPSRAWWTPTKRSRSSRSRRASSWYWSSFSPMRATWC